MTFAKLVCVQDVETLKLCAMLDGLRNIVAGKADNTKQVQRKLSSEVVVTAVSSLRAAAWESPPTSPHEPMFRLAAAQEAHGSLHNHPEFLAGVI